MPLVLVPCCWRCAPGPGDTAVCKRVCDDACKQHIASAPTSSLTRGEVVLDLAARTTGTMLPLTTPALYLGGMLT